MIRDYARTMSDLLRAVVMLAFVMTGNFCLTRFKQASRIEAAASTASAVR
jgi:hypothetical protein